MKRRALLWIWLCVAAPLAAAEPMAFLPLAPTPSLVRDRIHFGKKIVIDPGHGGKDIGTQSISKPRYREKSLNLVTAKFVREYLVGMGYEVILTREKDHFISLEERARFANAQGAALFVSIHYNAAPSREAEGIEVFYHPSSEHKKRTARSRRLAWCVLKKMLAVTGAKSRGVKTANYAVIRQTTMPAILVEGGFLTNEAELMRLKTPTYLKMLAWGVAQGVHQFMVSQITSALSTESGSSSARVERATCCLGGNRSIHLSYENKGVSAEAQE